MSWCLGWVRNGAALHLASEEPSKAEEDKPDSDSSDSQVLEGRFCDRKTECNSSFYEAYSAIISMERLVTVCVNTIDGSFSFSRIGVNISRYCSLGYACRF